MFGENTKFVQSVFEKYKAVHLLIKSNNLKQEISGKKT
jgi:Tfp pilus assembly major pilin PilA